MSAQVEQLRNWMEASEGEHLEFKEAKNNFEFETLGWAPNTGFRAIRNPPYARKHLP